MDKKKNRKNFEIKRWKHKLKNKKYDFEGIKYIIIDRIINIKNGTKEMS